MFENKLMMINFNYEKFNVGDFITQKEENNFYLIHCKYFLIDKKEEIYNFVLQIHGQITIISFVEFKPFIYSIKIPSIKDMLLFIEIFDIKIAKLETLFKQKKIENINECFNNNIFKITNNYEILINIKFHDNLIYFNITNEEIINELFAIKEIIEYKTN